MGPTADLQHAPAAIDLLDRAAERVRRSPLRRGGSVELPACGRLLATGDLHDNPVHLEKLLRLARLEASDDHHVILHEVIHSERLVNGVDLSHRMLLRIAGLIEERPDQVHLILANHELSQMSGKGVSKGAGNSVELFNGGLEYVYGDDWTSVRDGVVRFLRALPLAARSEAGILCAHSLPGSLDGFDSGILDRTPTDEDYDKPDGAAYRLVWGRRYTDETVEELAARWNVRLFCLGHQHVENGVTMAGPRVVLLNTDHEMATVLPLDLEDLPTAEEAMLAAVRLRSF